jgi:hypothetical protein
MLNKVLVTSALFLALGGSAMAQAQPSEADPKQVATIDAVMKQIQEALTIVQRDLKGKHLPQLKSVTLTLNTVVQKQAGATLKLWIITLGGKHENDETQEVSVTLVPPSPSNPTKVGAVSLSEALEKIIESAAEGVQGVSSGNYPLRFSGLTATIAFAIQNSGDAGGNIVILPVSIGLTGHVAKNQTQTLKVTFDDAPPGK